MFEWYAPQLRADPSPRSRGVRRDRPRSPCAARRGASAAAPSAAAVGGVVGVVGPERAQARGRSARTLRAGEKGGAASSPETRHARRVPRQRRVGAREVDERRPRVEQRRVRRARRPARAARRPGDDGATRSDASRTSSSSTGARRRERGPARFIPPTPSRARRGSLPPRPPVLHVHFAVVQQKTTRVRRTRASRARRREHAPTR